MMINKGCYFRIHGSKKDLVHQHDSWSSRASSILNSRESIYISRNELLQNLEDKKEKSMVKDKGARLQKHRIHDSWLEHF